MAGFQAKSEIELRNEYADMLVMYAEGGPEKVMTHILQKGRLEMQGLLAYLFVRSAKADIELFKLKEEKNDQPQHSS